MKRIFIAIKIEAGKKLLELMSDLITGLNRESVKWISIQNAHITLEFLGNTEEEKIIPLNLMLKNKCDSFGIFDIRIQGLGVFKSINDPRVIWAGIERSEKLALLNDLILNGLNETGIVTESRPFRPHLTLGRIRHLKSNSILQDIVDRHRDSVIQTVHINEVILYESTLFNSGPVYTPIGKYALQQSNQS